MVIRSSTEQELKKLVADWASAESRGDADFLNRTLTDGFVGIGPRGFMLTKEQWLARHRSGDLKYQSFAVDEVQVCMYDGAAIATARQTATALYQGRPMPGEFRLMLAFVQQQGRWLLAGSQLSPIAPAP
jgi:ketosteroid isomerase-like protein